MAGCVIRQSRTAIWGSSVCSVMKASPRFRASGSMTPQGAGVSSRGNRNGGSREAVKSAAPLVGLQWAEDLGQEFVVDLVELLEGCLHCALVVAGDEVEELGEVIGGVVHELFGVFEALGVAGEVDVDEVGVLIDRLRVAAALFGVAGGDLLAGLLGHGVDELGVEEALFAGFGLSWRAARSWASASAVGMDSSIAAARAGRTRHGGEAEEARQGRQGA